MDLAAVRMVEGGGGRVAPQLHSSMLHRRLTARSTRVCGFSARSTRDTVVLPQAARQVGVPGRVGETAHVHRLSQHRAIVTAMLLLSPPQCEHPHLPLLLWLSLLLLLPSWLTQLCVPLPPPHGSRRRRYQPGCSSSSVDVARAIAAAA